MALIGIRSDEFGGDSNDFRQLSVSLADDGGQGRPDPRPHWLEAVVEEDDVVRVEPRQPLAGPSVADYQRLVHLTPVRDRYNLPEPGHFGVLGELDAVGTVQSGHLLGVLAVVNQGQSCQEDHGPPRLKQSAGRRPQEAGQQGDTS